MKYIIHSLISFAFLMSFEAAFATEILCECTVENCSSVSFELNNETDSKVYMKAIFVESSIEGYAMIRKYNDRNIYSLGALLLIEDFEKGFKFPGTNRECRATKN